MPVHKEVPSLRQIATKKVAELVVDAVKWIGVEYGDYDNPACKEKVVELQEVLSELTTLKQNVYKQVEIIAHSECASFKNSFRVLFAVVMRTDRKVFRSDEFCYVGFQLSLLRKTKFITSQLEQCNCLVELDITKLHPDWLLKCNFFKEIGTRCKDTLKKIAFCFVSSEEAVKVFNNLQRCKELISVKGDHFLNTADFKLDTEYCIAIKRLVEALPNLCTLTVADLPNVLQFYEDSGTQGFSSTSLTSWKRYYSGLVSLTLWDKLLDVCPNVSEMYVGPDEIIAPPRERAHTFVDVDGNHMDYLNSRYLNLKLLQLTFFSDNFMLNISRLANIGKNLLTLKLSVCTLTTSDVFVLGQVCQNLKVLHMFVRDFKAPEQKYVLQRAMRLAGTWVIFSKLELLRLQTSNYNHETNFNFHEENSHFTIDMEILTLILQNARILRVLEIDPSFSPTLKQLKPFFKDGILENLTRFKFIGINSFRVNKSALKLILKKCKKLSSLQLLARLTDEAMAFILAYRCYTSANNIQLNVQLIRSELI